MLRHRLFALLVWASAAATAFVGSGQHMAAETAATVSSALTTQEARPGASPGLVEARRAFDAAGAKGDKAAYARYLAEDVTWITRSGRLQDKASLVDGLRATTPSSTPAVDIRPYPGGAVVVGTRNGNIRYLQVWVQKAGQWQMAAHHGATIEGANPPAGPITERRTHRSHRPASARLPTSRRL